MTEYMSISERNKQFDKMSRMQKRVAIARDVLMQMATKKITPERGTYLRQYTPGSSCHACALGSVALATLGEQATYRSDNGLFAISSCDMRDDLSPYFTDDELRAMEREFEYQRMSDTEDERQWESAEVILARQMNRIIRTKGKKVVARPYRRAV